MILLFKPSNSPIFYFIFVVCINMYAHVYNPLMHSWFTVLQVCLGDLLLESPPKHLIYIFSLFLFPIPALIPPSSFLMYWSGLSVNVIEMGSRMWSLPSLASLTSTISLNLTVQKASRLTSFYLSNRIPLYEVWSLGYSSGSWLTFGLFIILTAMYIFCCENSYTRFYLHIPLLSGRNIRGKMLGYVISYRVVSK